MQIKNKKNNNKNLTRVELFLTNFYFKKKL